MTKAFIDFMYVLVMQIFEWCNYVKMTGLVKSTLPFESPLNVDESSAKSVIENEFILCNEDLRHMEYMYRKEVPELQSVCKLFQMEQEKARKDRRLKNFPKSLTYWRLEAGKMEPQCEKALTAISEGLQPTAILYSQYPSERKQHSHDCLYTSKQHPTKRPSIVCFPYSLMEKDKPAVTKFGVLEQIFQHYYIEEIHVGFCVII